MLQLSSALRIYLGIFHRYLHQGSRFRFLLPPQLLSWGTPFNHLFHLFDLPNMAALNQGTRIVGRTEIYGKTSEGRKYLWTFLTC